MTITERIQIAIKTVKGNGIFVVAIVITIVLYLPKIVPVPIPLPDNYPIANPSMDVAVKAFKNKSYDMALSHFLVLAEAGDPLAQLMTGRMYAKGQGVKRDLCQLTYWIDKAARQGEFNAQLRLSDAYEYYYGINYDTDKAYLWLKTAKMNPNKEKSIKWYKDVTGFESDVEALFKILETFYTDADRQRLDKVFVSWDYTTEPPVRIIRIRDIPYVNGLSIVTPAIKPCY